VPEVFGLSKDDVMEAEVHFKKYDANGSGDIDKEELHKLISDAVGGGKTASELEVLVNKCFVDADTDKNGIIDEVEFLLIYARVVKKTLPMM